VKSTLLKICILFCAVISVSIADVPSHTLSYIEKFKNAVDEYEAGRFIRAENQFHSILTDVMDYNDPSTQMMWVKSLFHVGKLRQAMVGAESYLNLFPGSPYRKAMIQIMGDIHVKNGFYTHAFQSYLKARSFADIQEQNKIDHQLIQCIANGVKTESLETLLFREQGKEVRAILNLARAYDAYKRGDRYDARITLDVVRLEYLPPNYHTLYFQLDKYYLLGRNLKNIGVILPLTGEKAFDGQSYLEGLLSAFNHKEKLTNMSLFILDNESECTKTVKLVRQLRNDKKISGILGPLSDENAQCASAATEEGIPILIPDSNMPSLSHLSPAIFQLTTDLEARGRAMAHMLVDSLGLTQIAILAPADNERIQKETKYFADELYQMGIEPVAYEWYIGIPENVSQQFNVIRKGAWALVEEEVEDVELTLSIDSLDALFDVDVSDFFDIPEPEPKKKMSKNDSSKVTLSTIDALYMPIHENHLKYIGTQFPIYNLSCKVIGNDGWISPEIKQKSIGPHFSGMIVYTNTFDNNGWDTIVESHLMNKHFYDLGEDHGQFLISMGALMGSSRKALSEKLKKMEPYSGNYSRIHFKGLDQNMNILFQILKFSNNQFSIKSNIKKLD
jgi:hypothetical protein